MKALFIIPLLLLSSCAATAEPKAVTREELAGAFNEIHVALAVHNEAITKLAENAKLLETK